MTDRLSTGLSILDRKLNGGVPTGSLVALVAPAESQSELILDAHATTGATRYVTSVRPADVVREQIAEQYHSVDELNVVPYEPGLFAEREQLDALLDEVPEEGYLVVDTVEPLELLDRARQRDTLGRIREVVRDRDAVCLFQCHEMDYDTPERRRTLHHADLVLQLDLRPTTLKIENRLYVTKFRGGKALTEPVKLLLTDSVRIDTSRDIS